MDQILEKLKL